MMYPTAPKIKKPLRWKTISAWVRVPQYFHCDVHVKQPPMPVPVGTEAHDTRYDACEDVDRDGEQVRGRRGVANLYGYSVSSVPPGSEVDIVVPG